MSSTIYGRRTPNSTEIEFSVGDLDQDAFVIFDDAMAALTAVLNTRQSFSVGFLVEAVLDRHIVVVSTGAWRHRIAMAVDPDTARTICDRFSGAMHASQVIVPKTVN